MEEGKKAVTIEQWRWGWEYVPEARLWVYTITGVWAFSLDGKVYELKHPVSIGEWEKNCDINISGRFPVYECREDFISMLVESSK